MIKTLLPLAFGLLLTTGARAQDAASTDLFNHAQHRPRFQCEAQNLRGKAFFAVGKIQANVERKALNKCLKHSAQCHLVGCRVF